MIEYLIFTSESARQLFNVTLVHEQSPLRDSRANRTRKQPENCLPRGNVGAHGMSTTLAVHHVRVKFLHYRLYSRLLACLRVLFPRLSQGAKRGDTETTGYRFNPRSTLSVFKVLNRSGSYLVLFIDGLFSLPGSFSIQVKNLIIVLTSQVCDKRLTATLLSPMTIAKKEYQLLYSLQLQNCEHILVCQLHQKALKLINASFN